MNAPYHTIFAAELVQDSALSVGGNRPHEAVDDPLCLDGLGRYTLRGTTLAGALVATARKVYNDENETLARISRPPVPGKGVKAGPASLWRVFTAHPLPDTVPYPEFRQGVGIRHDTGAAAKGALFDLETLPRGTRWRFLLEVDRHRQGGMEAEGIAAHVLHEWLQGRAWIGRNVARGMGWVHLEKLQVWRLDSSHIDLWPNSEKAPWDVLKDLKDREVHSSVLNKTQDPAQWGFSIPEFDKTWYYHELEGAIRVGNRDDGYGLDGISVGGHGAGVIETKWDNKHFLAPGGLDATAIEFEPDTAIVMSLSPEGDREPILPGSSLRGPVRHCLSRHLRAYHPVDEPVVRDPLDKATPKGKIGPLGQNLEILFGDMEQSARLLIRDAHLDGDWHAAWLHQHAEDEFSRGVFGTGKFDRMALLDGIFCWRMVIEGANADQVRSQAELLEKALSYAKAGQLGVGGQQWRGLGWPRWQSTSSKTERVGKEDGER